MSEAPDEIIYMVDLDGTGSMHPCSKEDAGAVAYIRADLASAAPTVKPLEWEDYPISGSPVISLSETAFGVYFICDDTDDFSGLYCEFVHFGGATWYGTVEPKTDVIFSRLHVDDCSPLKEKAQADFERRILSALK